MKTKFGKMSPEHLEAWKQMEVEYLKRLLKMESFWLSTPKTNLIISSEKDDGNS